MESDKSDLGGVCVKHIIIRTIDCCDSYVSERESGVVRRTITGMKRVNRMVDISELFANITVPEPATEHGLTCQLEALVGGYSVWGEGETVCAKENWMVVHYDETVDPSDYWWEDVVKLENLVAIISEQDSLALVWEKYAEKFKADTKGFGYSYVGFPSLIDEVCCCSNPVMLPEIFQKVVWINDDFLYDENIEFDFAAFVKIDDGVQFVNPAHFSVEQLVAFIDVTNFHLRPYMGEITRRERA